VTVLDMAYLKYKETSPKSVLLTTLHRI